MDPSPGQLADEIDHRIRELPDRRTDAVRGVRREYTRRLRSSPPDAVLEVIDALVPRHRWVAYELLYHHPQAFGLLDRERVERLGRGLDSWGAVDAFGRYLSGPAWRRSLIADHDVHPAAVRMFLDTHGDVLAARVIREVRTKLETGRKLRLRS